jgi:hypothetical protein
MPYATIYTNRGTPLFSTTYREKSLKYTGISPEYSIYFICFLPFRFLSVKEKMQKTTLKLEEHDLDEIAHVGNPFCLYCALPITEAREGGICSERARRLATEYSCSVTWVVKVLSR